MHRKATHVTERDTTGKESVGGMYRCWNLHPSPHPPGETVTSRQSVEGLLRIALSVTLGMYVRRNVRVRLCLCLVLLPRVMNPSHPSDRSIHLPPSFPPPPHTRTHRLTHQLIQSGGPSKLVHQIKTRDHHGKIP